MNRRGERLRPSAPDFLYKEESIARTMRFREIPRKTLCRKGFEPDEVKKLPTRIASILAGILAEKEGFEPSRQLSHPTPLAGEPLRPLGYFSTGRFWRRERDSNPRCLAASLVFKTSAFNHSAISPQKTSISIIANRGGYVKRFFQSFSAGEGRGEPPSGERRRDLSAACERANRHGGKRGQPLTTSANFAPTYSPSAAGFTRICRPRCPALT